MVNVLDFIRIENNVCAEVAKLLGESESSLSEIVKEEVLSYFCSHTFNWKSSATVHTWLMKAEKALNLYNKIFWDTERDCIHITFIRVCCNNCPILLLVTVDNLSLCLIYKLNFIIGMQLWEIYNIIYRVEYHSWLQATTEGLVMYLEKGEPLYCFILKSVKSGLEMFRSFNGKWKNLN